MQKALAEQIKYGAYGYNPFLESDDDEDFGQLHQRIKNRRLLCRRFDLR